MSTPSHVPERQPKLAWQLDDLGDQGTEALRQRSGAQALRRALAEHLPAVVWIPAIVLVWQVLRLAAGGSGQLLPWPLLFALTFGLPAACIAWRTRAARRSLVTRQQALAMIDQSHGLQDRLVIADEFQGRAERTAFEAAALEDAGLHARQALEQGLAQEPVEPLPRARIAALCGLGLALVVASGWISGRGHVLSNELAFGSGVEAPRGTELLADAPRSDEDSPRAEEPEVPPEAPPAEQQGATAEPPKPRTAAPAALSDTMKKSSGKSGAGRSSDALSNSAASESKSAPSPGGASSQESPPKPTTKKPDPKQPKPAETPPGKPEETEEESGSTAGKGSSKGSSKNPTTSDWKSRDQVSSEDDAEVEDDDDTDDDEEEQESRGGTQPHLRDRRPPVSRDLQIGFGNRPSPDANGRGGPSQQKKSRGVASLVLGVPIPDRVKGRPGPGPTKITQERIEPQADEGSAVSAEARRVRAQPTGVLSAPDLEPWMRGVIQTYFLGRRGRASQSQDAPSNP